MAQERLEGLVRSAARKLEARGTAKLWKIPTDLRLTRNGAVHGDWTPCDFFGHTNQGRVIMVECKDIASMRLSKGKSGLKPHQQTALEECYKVGGIALLLWASGAKMVSLNPNEINRFSEGKRSIPWSSVEHLAVPISEDSILNIIEKHK